MVLPPGLTDLLEGAIMAAIASEPGDIVEFFALYFGDLLALQKEHPDLDLAELIVNFDFFSESENGGLENRSLESTDTLFSGEPKQKDKCTDTEEDQFLEEPDIRYSSKGTQYPSRASSIAENNSSSASNEASSSEEAELLSVPTEPAQLADYMLSDSLCSLTDEANSVQTLDEASQTSGNEFTPVEGAAEDPSAIPAAEASVEAVGSQLGACSQSSIAGEAGPSARQSDSSIDDVNQASEVPFGERSPPSPLPPPLSPAPQGPLQALPSCNNAEVPSITDLDSQSWHKEPTVQAEVPPYVEQFPQKTIIPVVDQTASQVESEQPLKAGQGSSTTTLGRPAAERVDHPEPMEATAPVETAEQPSLVTAMASREAEHPLPHVHMWTLYCLTDLEQGQQSPPSPPPARAGGASSQATCSPSSAEAPRGGQLAYRAAPIYIMQEQSTGGSAPPFIVVGSTLQPTQTWTPAHNHIVSARQGACAGRRFTTVPVPVARPASNAAEEGAAQPLAPAGAWVVISLDEVMMPRMMDEAQQGSAAGEKPTG